MKRLVLVSVCAALTACNNGPNGGPSAATACADEANALCMLRDSCGPNFEIARLYGTLAQCTMRTAATCVHSLAATGQGNTPAHVESCAAAYPGESCSDFFDGNPVAACVPPMGSLPSGAACGAPGQCASGYCAIAQNQVCGTCQPLPAVGASCQVQADCGRDLACAIPSGATTGSCAAFVPSGGACLTGHQPCQSGFACVGDDPATMKMGTCQTAGATVGAACDGSRKTAPSCDGADGFVCVPNGKGTSVGTCQRIALVAAGAKCGPIGMAPITGFAECEGGGLCDATGTCVAPAADGAACDSDPTKGPPCLLPAKCVPTNATTTAGTCVLPDATRCM